MFLTEGKHKDRKEKLNSFFSSLDSLKNHHGSRTKLYVKQKAFLCAKKSNFIGDEHVQLQRALQVAEKETI